jgi:hypothetical protein
LDNINIFLANEKARFNTKIGTSSHPPPMVDEWKKLDYWDSIEAILLFNPLPGKCVEQCLCDISRLLEDIVADARKVPTIIEDGDTDNKTQLNARQQQRIVMHGLYLRKAYENEIQCMNAWTWKECCEEAIKSI